MRTIFYFILRLVYGAAQTTCLLTLLGALGGRHWLLALLPHFQIQYTVFQAVGILIAAGFLLSLASARHPKQKGFALGHILAAAVLAGGLIYNIRGILPYYGPLPFSASGKRFTRPVTLMHINIFALNRRKDDVLEAIKAHQPDLIDFVEFTPDWQHNIETPEFLETYPYHVSGKAHVAVYSKFPIRSSSLFYSVPGRRVANHANLLVRVMVDGVPLSVLAVHPPVPAGPKAFAENKASFLLWERQRKTYGQNVIIIGDFNNTPWTPSFQKLLKHTDLRDSSLGFGLQPTWPMFLAPLGVKSKLQSANGLLQQINLIFRSNLFRIPIDHALVSPGIRILGRSTGPGTGSDHLPLTIRFDIAK